MCYIFPKIIVHILLMWSLNTITKQHNLALLVLMTIRDQNNTRSKPSAVLDRVQSWCKTVVSELSFLTECVNARYV